MASIIPTIRSRRNYIPVSFVPRQNPFYLRAALQRRHPRAIQTGSASGHSVVQAILHRARANPFARHRWIAIRKGNRTCYAQWEDCGPFRTDHFQYVFQNERPKPNLNRGAGLDVSPAVRDYLGLQPTDVTDWQFVEVPTVPPGPWRSYGDNNHFVIARRQSEQRLVQQSTGTSANKK